MTEPSDLRRRFEDVVGAVYVPLQRYLLRLTDVITAEDDLGDVLLVLWRRAEEISPTARWPGATPSLAAAWPTAFVERSGVPALLTHLAEGATARQRQRRRPWPH